MKAFIITLVLLISGFVSAQVNEDKIWEQAVYEVRTNGTPFYYTDVNVRETPFTKTNFALIKENMLSKEGIARVELLDHARVLRVYHFEYIEPEGIKSFILTENPDIEVMNRVPYVL